MATEASKRLVPGAPLPAPVSKTQKKKRKGAKKDGDSEPNTPGTPSVVLPDARTAALTEKAPEENDLKAGMVAEELVARPEAPKSETGEGNGPKASPVVDLLNKRSKAIGKKITRVQQYSSKPVSELNDDQKKTLATLPSLEAVRKELEEAKKAVEVLEAEEAKEAARARATAEEAEKQRIAESVAAVQQAHAARTAQILDFIRLQSLLSNADPSVQALNLLEAEMNAIYASVNALLAQEAEMKLNVLTGLLLGEGEIEGVPVGRLFEILDAHTRPTVEEVGTEAEQVVEAVVNALAEAELEAAEPEPDEDVFQSGVTGVPTTAGGMSFRFVQESELEGDRVSLEDETEWVAKEVTSQETPVVDESVQVTETYVPSSTAEAQLSERAGNGVINWADDEGELPSIDNLHTTFGTSGSEAPAPTFAPAELQNAWAKEPNRATEPVETAANGDVRSPLIDDDGFMQARGGRARGSRGRGFRGGERGGFRGGERGGFRGGGRGGGRGRPYHGSERGSWRASPDGEQRGRGRERGRGWDRGRGNGARGARVGGNEN